MSVSILYEIFHKMGAKQKAQTGIKKERNVPMFSIVSKHIKGSEELYLLGQDKTSKFSG